MRRNLFLAALFLVFFSSTARGQQAAQIENFERAISNCTFTITCFVDWDKTPLNGRTPLVIIHGINPSSIPGRPKLDLFEPFVTAYLQNAAMQARYKLYIATYQSNVVSVSELGQRLRDDLDAMGLADPAFGSSPVVILAHSMGGLVARAAMQEQRTLSGRYAGQLVGERVLLLITLGTPHHGSPMANGPARDFRAGLGWGLTLLLFDNTYFTFGPASYMVNRSDLRSDNYDGLLNLNLFSLERNTWLEGLNASRIYDHKIIAYGGTYAPISDCTAVPIAFASYCFGSRILKDAMGLDNDGVVPLSSAWLVDGVTGKARVTTRYFPDYNHDQIATGKGDGVLVNQLIADLLNLPANQASYILPGDFNGDGVADILVGNPGAGIWEQKIGDGLGHFRTTNSSRRGPGWIPQIADFDGDGKIDQFWHNFAGGGWSRTASGGPIPFILFSSWPVGWVGQVVNFNNDSWADMFVINPKTGQWAFGINTNPQDDFVYFGGIWPGSWNIYPADFDGDGRTDFLLYDPISGRWYEAITTGIGTFRYVGGHWDGTWRIYLADFNGDGRTDLLLFDPVTGQWFTALMRADGTFAYTGGIWSPGWDISIGDFNGDSRADVFFYLASTGQWYEGFSTGDGNFSYAGGLLPAGQRISVIDLDGDRRSDIVYYRDLTQGFTVGLNRGPGLFIFP